MSVGRKNVTNAVKRLFMLAFCFCHREKPAMSYAAVIGAVTHTHNFHWNHFSVFFIYTISHTSIASVLELLKNAFSVSYGI
jgi:hypothetical protein